MIDLKYLVELNHLYCMAKILKVKYKKEYRGPIPPKNSKDYESYIDEKLKMVELLSNIDGLIPFIEKWLKIYLNDLLQMVGEEKHRNILINELLNQGSINFFNKLKSLDYQNRYDILLEWSNLDMENINNDDIFKENDKQSVIDFINNLEDIDDKTKSNFLLEWSNLTDVKKEDMKMLF